MRHFDRLLHTWVHRLLSYWVITVVPYLLYCFVVDHSRETCERIYKVGLFSFAWSQVLTTLLFKIPVALAMWNQVGSECRFSRHKESELITEVDWHVSCPPHTHVCVFQQECIRPMVLGFSFIRSCCISALCGHNPDALYVSFFLSSIPYTEKMPLFSVAFR